MNLIRRVTNLDVCLNRIGSRSLTQGQGTKRDAIALMSLTVLFYFYIFYFLLYIYIYIYIFNGYYKNLGSFLASKIENYFWKQNIKGKNSYQTYPYFFQLSILAIESNYIKCTYSQLPLGGIKGSGINK